MKIRSIRAERFMSHDRLELTFPQTGVVLVTGPNGSGKSSLLEAVAMACWGKTLRGSSPWREGAGKGLVNVSTSKVRADRTYTKGKSALTWWIRDGHPTEYENATKAQDALTNEIGEMATWQRTHVFTSSGAQHFAEATDAERKMLLETLLGLDQFAPALDRCRADLRTATSALTRATTDSERRETSLEFARRQVAQAEDALAALPPSVDTGSPDALRTISEKAQRELSAVRARLRDLDLAGADSEALARDLRAKAERLRKAKVCPTCDQPVPIAALEQIVGRAVALTAEADASKTAAESERNAARDAEEELQAELSELQRRLGSAQAAKQQAAAHLAACKRLNAQLAAARDALREAEAMPVPDVLAAQRSVRELEATERVLGMRGVRAHVLGRALAGLESAANAWLPRFARADMRVKLRATTERKSGAVADAIALEVEGAGGGFGYRGASQGERRRVNVALLFALASMAGGSDRSDGTLFLDEALDGLDAAGIDAAADVLREIAQDRCVVVITHDVRLERRLAPIAQSWKFGNLAP